MIKFLRNTNNLNNIALNLFVFFIFFAFTFLSVKLIAPEGISNAEEQEVETTVGPYTLSMSNESEVAVDVVPTPEQVVHTTSSDISITNTCSSGATITMKTNKSTNSLERTGDDEFIKSINATTSSFSDPSNTLSNNSWGISLDNGGNWFYVPNNTQEPITIYNEERARTSSFNVPITIGIKLNDTIPSGNYTNDVIYTITPKSGCLTYSLSWDLNGGTGKSGADYTTRNINWGTTFNLTNYTPTRSGYTFTGWSNGTSTFEGTETSIDINETNTTPITMTAQWELDITIPAESCVGDFDSQISVNLNANDSQELNYSGNIVCAYLQRAGYYKLEAYGAQGSTGTTQGTGSFDSNQNGTYGKGGYAYGTIYAVNKSAVYVVVGQGAINTRSGGYNGGGTGDGTCNSGKSYGGGGGGATHIATKAGLLSSLSDSISSILLVAGGGGGSGGVWGNPYNNATALHLGDGGNGGGGNSPGASGGQAYYQGYSPGSYGGAGGSLTAGGAGGIGVGDSSHNNDHQSTGADGSFGLGGASNTHACSCNSAGAGGGGYYGGGGGGTSWNNECTAGGGGGGSGFIKATLANAGGVDGTRSGNGLARITYLGTNL